METSVFDIFETTTYTFLTVKRGGVYGNSITESQPAQGVFKHRDGMVQVDNRESFQSDATLHVKPTESFIAAVGGNMVGHGIRKDGQDYKIVGQTAGDNFATNVREHYRLTLQRTKYEVHA